MKKRILMMGNMTELRLPGDYFPSFLFLSYLSSVQRKSLQIQFSEILEKEKKNQQKIYFVGEKTGY